MKTDSEKSILLFDLKNVLKRALLPAALLLIAVTLFSPLSFLSGAGFSYPIIDEIESPSGTEAVFGEEKVYELFFLDDDCGTLPFPLYVFVLAVGLFAAFRQFGFLSSHGKTNVILSCGLSRRQLFVNRCAGTLLPLFLASALPLTVTLIVNLLRLGLHAYIFSAYFLFILSFFAAALIGFTVGAVGVILSGTLSEAAVGSVSLLLIPSEIVLLIQYCFNIFLKGYPGGLENGKGAFPVMDYFSNIEIAPLLYKTKCLNPLFLLYNPYAYDNYTYSTNLWSVYSQHQNGHFMSSKLDAAAPHILLFAVWIFLCVMALFFLNRMFQKRKAEIGGFYHKTGYPSTVFITAAALFAAGWGLFDAAFRATDGGISDITYFSLKEEGRLLCLETMLLYTFLAVAICLIIRYRDIRKWKQILKRLPLSLMVAIVPLCCLIGGFGYADYLPDAQNIEEILIDSPFAVTPLSFGTHTGASLQYRGFSSDGDKETVQTLHRLLITDTDRSADTLCRIYYKLKNGRIVVRNYTACAPGTLKKFTALFDTETVKDVMIAQFCDKSQWIDGIMQREYFESEDYAGYDPFQFGNECYEAPWLFLNNTEISLRPTISNQKTDITGKLTDERYDKLIRCIISDYCATTSDEFYTPAAPPLGVISIRYNNEDGTTAELPVYEGMELTTRYLRALGVLGAFDKKAEIESVKLYACTVSDWLRITVNSSSIETRIAEWEGKTTVSPTVTYTDKAVVAVITEKLYPAYLNVEMNVSYAAVTYKDGSQALFIAKD